MIEWILRGRLKLLTNLHIGTGISNDCTDSPVMRDATDRIFIPGTSLAGALRSDVMKLQQFFGDVKHIENNPECQCPTCALFGSAAPSEYSSDPSSPPTPSKIWVYDSYIFSNESDDDSISVIRDHVGISRVTSTAAHHAKYNEETIKSGTEFDFHISIETNPDHIDIFAAVLKEWESGRGFLGGGWSKGLGRVKLDNLHVFRIDLSSIEKVIDYLQSDETHTSKDSSFLSKESDWLENTIATLSANASKRVYVEIALKLSVDGGIVISDLISEFINDVEAAPIQQDDKYLIPGSSLRGALRAQAERIIRTIATDKASGLKNYLEICPACHPFNLPNSEKGSCEAGYKILSKEEQSKIEIKKKVCLACHFFGMTHLGSRISISDGVVQSYKQPDRFNFVAIDRFTGGSLDKALFNATILMYPKFTAELFLENPEDWELGWLMYVIRDIRDGFVTAGRGKSKWFGQLKLEGIEVRELWAADKATDASTSRDGVFAVKNKYDLLDKLWEGADTYIDAFHKTIEAHKWELRNGDDSYFGQKVSDTLSLSDIYAKEGQTE